MFTKKLVSFVVSDELILKGFIRKFNCLDMCYATDCPLRFSCFYLETEGCYFFVMEVVCITGHVSQQQVCVLFSKQVDLCIQL